MDPERIIKNRTELVTSQSREKVVDIIEAGIRSVLPSSVMPSAIKYYEGNRTLLVKGQKFDLSQGRVFVVGGGKASGLMAQSMEAILGAERITAGIVSDKYGVVGYNTKTITVRPAGHPVPDEEGIKAVQAMLRLKSEYGMSKGDTVICLISGGGSALMPYPVDGVTLEMKQQVTRILLGCGADITEINCIRKHLSKVKGGRMGQYFSPATVITLIISDVVGNDLSVIASGPTYPDRSTFSQALMVIEKYGLISRMPGPVVDYLRGGVSGQVEETPKVLVNCHNFIIGDNSVALSAMKDESVRLGLKPMIITSRQTGNTDEVAFQRASEIVNGKYTGFDILLIGGETVPVLPSKHGRGGRNQHYAAVSLLAMKDSKGRWLTASIGTDGSDFLSDIAGAIVDNSTLNWLSDRRIVIEPYIEDYDSFGLLTQVPASLIKTGNTGTNVGDVVVYLVT